MKKLSKLKLKEFHEMSNSEMRNVVGGYDSYGSGGYIGRMSCVANKNWDYLWRDICFTNVIDAETFASPDGHWCCNCERSYAVCGW